MLMRGKLKICFVRRENYKFHVFMRNYRLNSRWERRKPRQSGYYCVRKNCQNYYYWPNYLEIVLEIYSAVYSICAVAWWIVISLRQDRSVVLKGWFRTWFITLTLMLFFLKEIENFKILLKFISSRTKFFL